MHLQPQARPSSAASRDLADRARIVSSCVTVGALTLLLACGPGDGPGEGAAGSGSDTPGAEAGGPGAAANGDGGARVEGSDEGPGGADAAGERSLMRGDTVLVYMDEYVIDMPLTVPAGSLSFRVRNVGFEEHNFEILQNDSLLWSFDSPLNPAEELTLDVVLEPGEYDVLCTVSGHEGRGMQEVLTVTAPDR